MAQDTDFNQIYQKNHKGLFSFLCSIVGEEDAYDILQDTMEKFLHNLKKGQIRAGEEVPWLYRVAHNRAIDSIRMNKRRSTGKFSLTGEMETRPDPVNNLQEMDRNDLVKLMYQFAGKFSKDGSGVLLLHLLSDKSLSKAEIASSLDISERTLRRRISSLFAYIQKEFEKSGYKKELIF